jgi:hypothetical protein
MDYELENLKNEFRQHAHTGVDSQPVYMGDLKSDNRGLIFSTTQGAIILKYENGLFTLTPPENNTIDYVIGNTNPFNQITLQATTINSFVFGVTASILDYVDDATETGSTETFADHIEITSSASATTGWWIHLPDNANLPASPTVGDICIFGGILQVCEVAGVWTPK